ncbi:MAG: adenylate/guanylate cyclase domain-containing response regulator [Spirochaetia bacterium]|nr:adenylate/guanylate cyclase domain-containing response regulator [Spirochaetia bacterium]
MPTLEEEKSNQLTQERILATRSTFGILIVEDDAIQSQILREFLELLRYEVREAEDGAQARAALNEEMPDLILLDVNLPDISGLDLLKEIHQIDPDASVVLMSSDKDAGMLLKALEEGVEEFLEKPLVLSELAIRVQNILETVAFRKKSIELQHELAREMEILSRHFSRETVEALLKGEITAEPGGDVTTTTVLVFDLRNSTAMAERMGPLPFSTFLNEIMVDLMDLVLSQNGSIAKLTGDGMIASFAGGHTQTGPTNALRCAERIEEYFQSLQAAGVDTETGPLGFGIGIGTGPIFQGNIGTLRRLEFTLVGDALSRASRLESLTKKLGGRIICDKPTMRGAVYDTEKLRPIHVRIRGKMTTIYSLQTET